MADIKRIMRIKRAVAQELLQRPGITGVDVGYKYVGGERTDEIVIRIFVAEKKEVSPAEALPETIQGIKTDVIEFRPALADNRDLRRLAGGQSIGGCGSGDTGTTCAIVRDQNNSPLVLTCDHVLSTDDQARQPGALDGGTCPDDLIGDVVKRVGNFEIDAALVRVTALRNVASAIDFIGPVTGVMNPSPGMAVRQYGNVTRKVRSGIIDGLDWEGKIEQPSGDKLEFKHQITIRSVDNLPFGVQGDSGSAVVNDANAVVAMCIATETQGSGREIATSMRKILDSINMSSTLKVQMGVTGWHVWGPLGSTSTSFEPLAGVAAVSQYPNSLDVFALGKDGKIYTSWWQAKAGKWDAWKSIGDASLPFTGSGISAVSRFPDQLDLFVVTAQGTIATAWWNKNLNGGQWFQSPYWFQIGSPPGGFAFNSQVTAVSQAAGSLDVFAVGNDGRVYTKQWNALPTWNWNNWTAIQGTNIAFSQNQRVAAALVRQVTPQLFPGHLDIFAVGWNGSAYWASWDFGGAWSSWSIIGGPVTLSLAASMAAVARTANHIDLFAIGQNGILYTTWGNPQSKQWQTWVPLGGAPPVRFALSSQVTAVAQNSNHLDVFAIGEDGGVYSTSWDASNGKWNPWFRIGAPSLTPVATTSCVPVVCQYPNHLDLFMVDKMGNVRTTWWDAQALT